MGLLLFVLSLLVLMLFYRTMKLEKRLIAVEHTKDAVDILAEQVLELSGDFYGPSAE